ncbi:MAG TPA: preprotein translocase subunit SecA, partial [Bacteroidales bacterium]|nr:preprotein translocase subunit SecA [Bacteroidales bacterium]
LLEYDDVMNAQREVIYRRRRNALHGERLSLDIRNMMEDVCENLIEEYSDSHDFQGFRMELLRIFSMDSPINENEFYGKSNKDLHTLLFQQVYRRYKQKTQLLAEKTYPVIKDVFENHSQYEYIAVPLTDGRKQINLVVNLKKAYQDRSREVVLTMEKTITLAVIDNSWKEHLREMDDLKQSVQNAVYEQKDPLLIYKFESFELFSKMLLRINKEITSFLMMASIPGAEAPVREASMPKRTDRSRLKEQREDLLSQANPTQTSTKPAPVKVEKRVGRNDPCPCGSGKKYKNCHGRIEN